MNITSIIAVIGILLNTISPFSIISNMSQLALTVLVALGLSVLVAATGRSHARQTSIHVENPGTLIVLFVIIFLHAIFMSAVSFFILLMTRHLKFDDIVYRNVSQLISLVVGFFEILCGYYMAARISEKIIRLSIRTSFWIMLACAFYQLIAFSLGLPFIGKYVDDAIIGLRSSALAFEPKALSVYLICLVFYYFDDIRTKKCTIVTRITNSIAILAAVYFFLISASANGFVALALLLFLRFIIMPIRLKIKAFTSVAILGAILISHLSLNDLPLREVHKTIIENITNLDLSYFDDLISLPMMAWRDNLLMTLFGFGPGMMNFFARDYLSFATWLTGKTYIEGNLSIIMYASNFGVILYLVTFGFIFSKAVRNLNASGSAGETVIDDERRTLDYLFFNFFVVGAMISANESIPLFISIGWIIYRARRNSIHRRAFYRALRLPISI